MTVLLQLAAWSCVLAAVFWVPATRKNLRARFTVLALAAGSVALFTRGTIVSYEVLDAFLGGSNVLKLIQVVLALLAFWALSLAVMQGRARAKVRVLIIINGVALSAMVVAFFTIKNRAPSSMDFLVRHGAQPPTAIFGGAYMLAILLTALAIVHSILGIQGRDVRCIRLGALVVAFACVAEIAVLLLRWREAAPTLAVGLDGAFDLGFYGGVVVIAIGMGISSWSRRSTRRPMERVCLRLEKRVYGRVVSPHPRGLTETALLERLFQASVASQDAIVRGSLSMTAAELEELDWTQNLFTRQEAS